MIIILMALIIAPVSADGLIGKTLVWVTDKSEHVNTTSGEYNISKARFTYAIVNDVDEKGNLTVSIINIIETIIIPGYRNEAILYNCTGSYSVPLSLYNSNETDQGFHVMNGDDPIQRFRKSKIVRDEVEPGNWTFIETQGVATVI